MVPHIQPFAKKQGTSAILGLEEQAGQEAAGSLAEGTIMPASNAGSWTLQEPVAT